MSHCDDLRSYLDELLDDRAPAPVRARLEDHLASCASCRDELASALELRRLARALGGHVAPSRDLWPAIERRLAPRPSRIPLLALAASVLAALGLALLAALWMRPNALPEPPVAKRRSEAIERAAELARYEDGTLASRRELIRALERRRDRLPPQLADSIERNMEILQTATGEIRHAIEHDPSAGRFDQLLADRYQQEAKILRQLETL